MTHVTEENLTDLAIERWSNIPDPRLRQIMMSLVKHLHAFVRDVEPTPQEWFAAIDWLTRTGQICDAKRQEFILTSDVLGISMLVDSINHRAARRGHTVHRRRPVPYRQFAGTRRRRQHGGRRARHSRPSSPAR